MIGSFAEHHLNNMHKWGMLFLFALVEYAAS